MMPLPGRPVRVLSLVVAALVLPCALAAQAPPSPVPLERLEFIAGRWVGELGGGAAEELWSPPAGDNMMGVFRYVKDGRAVFYEIMVIERDTAGPVLRLKHFNPGLTGWEEKAEVWSYPLVRAGPAVAVFERPDGGMRMTYRRAEDTLTVLLEQRKDGKLVPQEFVYRLAR